jgi:hypothetical protein
VDCAVYLLWDILIVNVYLRAEIVFRFIISKQNFFYAGDCNEICRIPWS